MNKKIYSRYEDGNLKVLEIKNIDEIRNIIYDFDKVFKPSLSERITDLNLYVEKLYNNASIFAAIEDKEFIGFIAFYANDKNSNLAYLTQIAVKTKAQNRNIGKTLLELCIETSRNYGMTMIELEVYKDNSKAIDFYKNHGFDFCGDASIDSIYMSKKL